MADDALIDLLCPHNKDLYVGPINGVTHYAHEDGDSCRTLNSFVQQAQRTLAEMAVLEGIGDVVTLDKDGFMKKATPIMRSAYIVSLELRSAYYRKMSSTQDREVLKKYLVRLSQLVDQAHNQATLAWELEATFGGVIWSNLNRVSDMQLHTVAETPRKPYRLPRMEMINIQNIRITSDLLDLENEVNQKTKGRRW